MTKTSDDYERFVQNVMRELVRDSVDVRHQHTYVGKVSGRKIKVDVSFEIILAGGAKILVLVECKHYSHTVEVSDIEEFHSKIDDIGAHKGIMVTTEGYQSGTKAVAKGREIALALLTDDSQPDEINYIDAARKTDDPPPFLRGNLSGIMENHEGGYSFTGATRLYNLLIEDLSRIGENGA